VAFLAGRLDGARPCLPHLANCGVWILSQFDEQARSDRASAAQSTLAVDKHIKAHAQSVADGFASDPPTTLKVETGRIYV